MSAWISDTEQINKIDIDVNDVRNIEPYRPTNI